MANPPELVWLDNLTPKSTLFNDTYYSRDSGLEETRYVFINGNNLTERWQEAKDPVIGELGFGTGLNFLATWQAWQNTVAFAEKDSAPKVEVERSLTFISFEKYPMAKDNLFKALSPWPELSNERDLLLQVWSPDASGWQTHHFGNVTLELFIGEAADGLETIPDLVDAWYLDGFNPKTNPDLWSLNLLRAVSEKSNSQATLASYTAAGWVRRNLNSAGFSIAKRKGFGHKRDMITGELVSHPLR
ncbi:tRNA (5-methylaminomethyl-2-thiouridine)(34)-methyltransferase MnmD [uncultured Cohaesibacter sp.]|uniref:tRNA (5-methylaminomethyl-2-thiouridine)(34)-methyltransferase MnmD n=1 Tax=uncultured Cohaesibacter sp. TaxID=1002546 RepID=UPI00292F1FA7|nr:tRNA (5-methylaminomethyl-2-thiouridine)(34)-methyltransferase MnmD [uncultured Cohaesibacter sp.]